MHAFLQSRIQSFKHAFCGIRTAVKSEKNLWIHAGISLCVILVSFWLSLPARDWAVLLLTMAIVFVAEMINTSIEVVIDLIQPDYHPLAKAGKDIAAAAVLLAAIASVFIGLLILGPPLYLRLF